MSFIVLALGQLMHHRSIADAVRDIRDGIRWAGQCGVRSGDGFSVLIFTVRIYVETAKQVQEDGHVDHEEDGQRSVQFAVQVNDEREVAEHDGKLNELDPGDVLLPPQIFAVLWSHGGQHVVEVHEDVHKRVEEANHHTLFAWNMRSGSWSFVICIYFY